MRALVTAFEPFGGESVNSSLEAVRRVPARIGDLEIATAELPTSFARSLPALAQTIADVNPAIVLCVGQARTRDALSMERVAINVQDARLPDNDGAQPLDLPVVAGGPAAYFATLPVRSAVAALHAAGLRAEISNTAGTFVCNHVFYGLMHFAMLHPYRFCGGVLHVPRLESQAAGEPGAPCMALDEIVRGIVIVLETAAARSSAGARR